MRLALLLVALAIHLGPGPDTLEQQDNLPDVPKTHWVYEDLAHLRKLGLLIGYPSFTGRGGRPSTRYELAVAVHATATNLRTIVIEASRKVEGSSQPLSKVTQEKLQGMMEWPSQCDALLELAKVFQPELNGLEVDMPTFLAEIRGTKIQLQGLIARLPGFPDVPKDHWAYKAVEELREAGILVGYPDGKLRG